ncbi:MULTISPECIES: protease [unclassified Corallococcus]|uniref:protease n=1 Tax=unclassified Corallococcus TaxID=2685029 RepID=UPI001A8C09CE|nr:MULTISPECIES: protease [unclassified Corallococcus]MBN9686518.1 protease [Corallococcus sp. NCSPR001]WAS82055.1 protease [Corallococcus sp. NCRR]
MGMGRSNLAWLAVLTAAGVTACTPKPAEAPAQQQAPVAATPPPAAEPAKEPTAMTTPKLECALSVQPKAKAGEPIEVLFKLTNRSESPVWVLKWQTPLEGILGTVFQITRDGEELPYQGPMVKRAAPSADSYAAIAPGATVENTVEVTQAWDFKKPGTYRITFRDALMDVATRKEDVPRAGGEYQSTPVTCAPVDVTVAAR